MSATRMTGDERRRSVLAAALAEFALAGMAGTSTEVIAARAGISQPYLFRLFPTKKALFIACIEECFGRVERRFLDVSEGLSGHEALEAMGFSYSELLADRELLLAQHQAYAACGDPEVRAAVRRCFGRLWTSIEARSGCGADDMQLFFAKGMLCNAAAAMDLADVGERWAQDAMPLAQEKAGGAGGRPVGVGAGAVHGGSAAGAGAGAAHG